MMLVLECYYVCVWGGIDLWEEGVWRSVLRWIFVWFQVVGWTEGVLWRSKGVDIKPGRLPNVARYSR